MPTKKRREDAEKRRKQREEDERAWAEFDATCAQLSPEEQAARRARWAAVAAYVAPDDWGIPDSVLRSLRTPGITFDKATGEPMIPVKHGTGGNVMRAADKADAIEHLRQKYREFWNVRNGAKKIAAVTGLSVETVRRYFRETRKDDKPK